MDEVRKNRNKDSKARFIAVALCASIFGSTVLLYPGSTVRDNSVTALATDEKEFRWEKKAVSEGTTIDADYLWPEESNVSFTAVYRDGELLQEDRMITVTKGSVYHFRGISDESVLYTQVYVGSVSGIDVTSGETGTWYKLLPEAIRTEFEDGGWTWETGWEYTGRAYLDSENRRVMVKTSDSTAVLYGIGLYLDDTKDYSSDGAFTDEGDTFQNIFGDTDNVFASALEYYYTKGGELRARCPKIYAMVADAMYQLDAETAQIRNNTESSTESSTESGNTQETPAQEGPGLMGDLLEYVNSQREQAGLNAVAWDEADDVNVITRAKEVKELFSQTRPDGTDAFSAYTDAVMCEMRLEDAITASDMFDCSSSYFLMPELISFTCAIYDDTAVLVFVW